MWIGTTSGVKEFAAELRALKARIEVFGGGVATGTRR
jgi:hypothetical protein